MEVVTAGPHKAESCRSERDAVWEAEKTWVSGACSAMDSLKPRRQFIAFPPSPLPSSEKVSVPTQPLSGYLDELRPC